MANPNVVAVSSIYANTAVDADVAASAVSLLTCGSNKLQKINSLIIDNVKRLGSTSITITHDLSSLNKIANKVAMINEGKIIWHGEKEDLQKSKNKTLNEFINIESNARSKT